MNLALFRWQMRKSLLIGINFAAILTLYVTMITSMYDPQSMAALVKFRDSMPQVMAAVGMDNAPTTLPEFLVNFLYGFLFLVFPMVFTLIRAHGTMARYIDSGALATLLASPVSRRSLALTQFAVVITGTTMLLGYVTALEAIAALAAIGVVCLVGAIVTMDRRDFSL